MMQVLVNTDNHIQSDQEFVQDIKNELANSLNGLSEYITRIEVHLSDENSKKPGENDKRCLLEARIKNHQPIVVSEHAPTLNQATNGAIDKLKRALIQTLERIKYK